MEKSLSPNRTALFWLVVLGIPLALLIAVKAILLPFVIGMLSAYFLDPAADRLEKWKLSRGTATFLIVFSFFATVALVLALVLPILVDQLTELALSIPEYVSRLQEHYGPKLQMLYSEANIHGKNEDAIRSAAQSISSSLLGNLAHWAGNIVESGFALVNLFALIFVTPVVSFYLLRDWDRMVAKINALLPRKHLRSLRLHARNIDHVLSGFVRGQTNVCLFLALFYSIGLTLAGLHYGLALGIIVGFLTFIPYVGSFFGLACGTLLAFAQYGDFTHVAIIVGIFLTGQFIESNFIAPKWVGKKVGLHPVWIIFGLLAGGHLFGFVGVLIAVPTTAIIGVLVRAAIDSYLESRFYSGTAR